MKRTTKSAIILTLVLVLGSSSAGAKISGTGTIDLGTSVIDRKDGFEYYNSMQGDGHLEMGHGNGTAPEGGGHAKGFGSGVKIAYSGEVPLVGLKQVQSKSLADGTKNSFQESFSVNEMESEQSSYQDPGSQLVGFENKVSFNGTWETTTSSHAIFKRDIKSHQKYSGNFEIEKLILFGSKTKEASLSLKVTPSHRVAWVGDETDRHYEVANTGGTTIPDVKVIDSRLGFVALDRTYLNPGEVAVGSANYTIGQEDAPGPINDTVWASGSDLRRNAVTVNANVSVELVLPPALDLDQGPVNEVPPSPGNS